MSAEFTPAEQTVIPATAMQESMWWIQQRAAVKSVYNITWRMACGTAPDYAALCTAWQELHDRHDALRSGLRRQDGAVALVVEARVPATPEHVVVPDPGSVPAGELLRLIAEELHERPFKLDHAPLARLALVSVAGRHELVLTVHHSMIDGWGIQLLLTDLSQAYQSALGGEPGSFGADPVSFADYARRNHAMRDGNRWQASLEHWRATLRGVRTTTLVAERHEYTGTGGRGEIVRHPLDPAVLASLRALARQAGTTPFAVLLTAFHVMLARGGGGPDVAVGVAAANRLTRREQELVGYTSNLCVSRAVIDDDEAFSDVLARNRDSVWIMLAHQEVPFPLVYAALDAGDQAGLQDTPPLLLSYMGAIDDSLHLGDIPMNLMASPNRAARCDLCMVVYDHNGQYIVEVEYSTGRYERDSVLRLLRDVDTVVMTAVDDPGRRVGDFVVQSRFAARMLEDRADVIDTVAAGPVATDSASLEIASRLWGDVLGSPPADPDEDFFARGGHSLKVILLSAAIEADSGREFDVLRWLAEPTPRQIAAQLSPVKTSADPSSATQSTVAELRDGGGLHLHLLPGAGGGLDGYDELITALPGDWRITASQERAPLDSTAAIAQQYLTDLNAAGLRPDLLVGWSFGGQIGYEMASSYDNPAPRLAVLDAPPPVGYPDLSVEKAYQEFAVAVLDSLGVPPSTALSLVQAGDPELLSLRVLTAYLAAGQAMPFEMLAMRWHAYLRHIRAAAAHLGSRQVQAPGLVVAADLPDSELDQWTDWFKPAPRLMRVGPGHVRMLRGQAARDIGAAIVALAESTVVTG